MINIFHFNMIYAIIKTTNSRGLFMANNYTDNFAGEPYFIKKGEPLSADGMTAALNTREKVANKKDTINNSSTEYPSSKAVYTIDSGVVHKAGVETITGVKTFGTASTPAEPVLGKTKTAAVVNDGTKFASEAQVYAVNSALSSKQDSLPIGTILMFDGASWKDNNTLPGWYACTAANKNLGLTPNLEDHFIVGAGAAANKGTEGGSNFVTLSASNIPQFDTNTTNNLSGDIPIKRGNSVGVIPPGDTSLNNGIVSFSNSPHAFSCGVSSNRSWPLIIANINVNHKHTCGTPAQQLSPIDNRPSYYAVIYIKKIA
jgi:hypothetical protein